MDGRTAAATLPKFPISNNGAHDFPEEEMVSFGFSPISYNFVVNVVTYFTQCSIRFGKNKARSSGKIEREVTSFGGRAINRRITIGKFAVLPKS